MLFPIYLWDTPAAALIFTLYAPEKGDINLFQPEAPSLGNSFFRKLQHPTEWHYLSSKFTSWPIIQNGDNRDNDDGDDKARTLLPD